MENILSGILNADWLTNLFQLVLLVLMKLVKLLMTPIDLLITSGLPDLANAFSKIPDFFNTALTYTGFIIDALLIPPVVISLIFIYFSFVITTSLSAWGFKLIVRWVDTLR